MNRRSRAPGSLQARSLEPWWVVEGEAGEFVVEGKGFEPGLTVQIGWGATTLTLYIKQVVVESPERAIIFLRPFQGMPFAYYPVSLFLGTSARSVLRPGLMVLRPGGDRFMRLIPEIREGVRRNFIVKKLDPETPAAKATFRINAENIPDRCERLLAPLQRHMGISNLRRLDILDIGTGYGTMGLYLTCTQGPRMYIAADLNPDFYAVSEELRRKRPEDFPGLEYRHEDMRRMNLPSESIDLVICHGALMYNPEWRDVRRSLLEFHRVLRPGGVLLLYGPNRWFPREAYTGLYGIQFLPRSWAHWISLRWGKRSGYRDVRLFSPLQMWYLLTRVGFQGVRIETPRGKRDLLASLSMPFWPYIYTTARKPGPSGQGTSPAKGWSAR